MEMFCLEGFTECREARLSPARKWGAFSLYLFKAYLAEQSWWEARGWTSAVVCQSTARRGHSGSERLLCEAKARVAKPPSQQTGSVFTHEGPGLLAAPAGLRCGFISEHSFSGGFSSLHPPLSFCVSISTAANTYHASLTEM